MDRHGSEDRLDTSPGGPGGAPIAIGLLVLILLLLVFLFREELGIGSPTAEIAVPDRFETEIPERSGVPREAALVNEASPSN